ncbi:hypothetical protein [Bacillus sp. B-jedd]|uniref:hypothetical protein n=1 Tax=Bacillus sp. B-jedd TaxID=1476857 RepID=UPI0005156148|nr:hypothetical protein [Bacillus sp. B-jedd]CEG25911.1 hypothetical protein BN1002_00731 [Bacillus sp. B-jedd]
MIQQQQKNGKNVTGKVYNFFDYKKKKPYFLKPIKITVGNSTNETYYMIKNLVYMEKQILVLRKEQDPFNIILVEAKIENGSLKSISMLPKDLMSDISGLLKETI